MHGENFLGDAGQTGRIYPGATRSGECLAAQLDDNPAIARHGQGEPPFLAARNGNLAHATVCLYAFHLHITCPAPRDQAGLAALKWVNMIPDLGEMVSLVTGANRGIGREVCPQLAGAVTGLEVCRQLAGRGHTVVLTARSADAAATAAREAAAEPLRLDLTDPASVADAALGRRRHGLTPAPLAVSSVTAARFPGSRRTLKKAIGPGLLPFRRCHQTRLAGS